MNAVSAGIDTYTLIFKDENMENKYQQARLKLEDFSLSSKIILAAIILLGVLRRVQETIDSIRGANPFPVSREIQITLELILGLVLEIPLAKIERLNFLKGSAIIIGVYASLFDGSCMYIKDQPGLTPLGFPVICCTFIVTLYYMKNMIVSTTVLLAVSVMLAIFYNVYYDLNIVDRVFFSSYGLPATVAYLLANYSNELHDRNSFLLLHKNRSNKTSLKQLLQKLRDGVVLCEENNIENVVYWNQTMINWTQVVDPDFKAEINKTLEKQERKRIFKEAFLKNIKLAVSTTAKNTLESDLKKASSEKQDLEKHYVFTLAPDNTRLYYSLNWSRIEFDDTQCMAFIFRDETALIELERKKEDENYRKRLIASITHDLRTPLNGLMGIYDALKEFVLADGQYFIKLAKNTGSLMLNLINDVLDMSQIEAKKLKLWKAKYNPREVIEETVALMKFNFVQKKVLLNLFFEDNIPTDVFTDMSRYRQILLNLLGNALKFTSKGSVNVQIKYDEKFDCLITKVKDSGPGIPKEDFPQLFTLFGKISNTDRLNPTGVGLGLHICKQLSKQLGGDIYAESEEEKGATFTFYISCGLLGEAQLQINLSPKIRKKSFDIETSTPSIEYIKSVMKQENANLKSSGELSHVKLEFGNNFKAVKSSHKLFDSQLERISSKSLFEGPQLLIVDDSQMNIFALKHYLKESKLQSQVAYNGKEALDIIYSKKFIFSAIYMDVNMPILNGIEATKILRAEMADNKLAHTPIIALSADSEIEENDIFDEILVKPISKENFLKSISKYTTIFKEKS